MANRLSNVKASFKNDNIEQMHIIFLQTEYVQFKIQKIKPTLNIIRPYNYSEISLKRVKNK